MTQVQLREQVRRTKGKLNTICVTFDLDTMEGFRNRKRVSFLLLLHFCLLILLSLLAPPVTTTPITWNLSRVLTFVPHLFLLLYTLIVL